MSDLSLHFINNELYRVSFSHPALKEQIISYRGKTFENSFQWTPAVKALAVFLLKNVASEEGAKPKLEGTESSLASSLDYALSKQPQWTFDVFGRDKRGKTLLRKLIRRTNPERKRPGPVILELNEANISAKNIQILSDNNKVTEKEKILDLCSKIEKTKG